MSNRSATLNNPSLKDPLKVLLDNNLIEIANYLMKCSTFLFYAAELSTDELTNCIEIIMGINRKTSFNNNPEAIKKASKIEDRFKLQEDRSESNPDNISKEDFDTVVTFIQEKLEELNGLRQQLEKSEELKSDNYSSCKNHLKNLAKSLERIIAIKQQAYSDDEPSVLEFNSESDTSDVYFNTTGSGDKSDSDEDYFDVTNSDESDSDEDYFDVTNSGESDSDEDYFDVTNSGDDPDSGYESSTSEVEFDTTGLPDVPDFCHRQWPSRSSTLFDRRKPNTTEEKEINEENQSPVLNA